MSELLGQGTAKDRKIGRLSALPAQNILQESTHPSPSHLFILPRPLRKNASLVAIFLASFAPLLSYGQSQSSASTSAQANKICEGEPSSSDTSSRTSTSDN